MLRRRQPDGLVEPRPPAPDVTPPEPHPAEPHHAEPHHVHPHVRTTLAVLAAISAGTAVVQATAVSAHDEWASSPPSGGLVLELPGRAPDGDQLALPDAALSDLAPGDVRTLTVRVTNLSRDAQAVAPAHRWVVDGTDGPPVFVDPPSVDVAGLPHVLEPGASALVTVTVATPARWAPDNFGRGAQLVVRFVGTHV